jgi:hypothetical protein
MPINTQLLQTALLMLKQAQAMPLGMGITPAIGGTAPQTDSGAQPRPGIPPRKSTLPPRKGSPNGIRRGENSNGHEMTMEEAWHIVETAVDQAQRMRYAADLATRLDTEVED